jgi:hypothetical protein
MIKILLLVVSSFLSIPFVYAQSDTTSSEEDSIVFIDEAPLIIKRKVEVILPIPQKKWTVILLAHAAPSFFKDGYKTTSTGTREYTNTVKGTLKGNHSFRWGGEVLFVYNKKNRSE